MCAGGVLAAGGDSVHAAPSGGGDDDASVTELRHTLEQASRGYLDAQSALENSQNRQHLIAADLTNLTHRLNDLERTVSQMAVSTYRAGTLIRLSSLFDSGSPDVFLDRISVLRGVSSKFDALLGDLAEATRRLEEDSAAIGREIDAQRRHVDEMGRQREAAERALASAGGGRPVSGPATSRATSAAIPAPQGPKSKNVWTPEGCSERDPTTSGCVTPRMLHALRQVQQAGFDRHVSCHRSSGGGEHPKGRACDFASGRHSFGTAALGGDKTYGDSLAGFLVGNAQPLGVLYVIWFRQIWLPSSGWRSYAGGHGDPSSDHTDHVHLSVR